MVMRANRLMNNYIKYLVIMLLVLAPLEEQHIFERKKRIVVNCKSLTILYS